jgi:DNA-binding NtrC family response regulator
MDPAWQVTRLNPERPPVAVQPDFAGNLIGVCDLSTLTDPCSDSLRQWLELLPAQAWLALVRPEQLELPPVRRLIQDYCQDYHTLPADWPRLQNTLGHLWGMAGLSRSGADTFRRGYQDFVLDGPSQAIRQTRSLLRRFAVTREPVLIYGESGTGREAAAEFVHRHSGRAHQPLVHVNCAALPPSLTQSELFGHERGAFTHALKARKGRIEAANGGTLVLAGADELNLDQQSAILRFLQEGQIEPVGSNRPVSVDVRIIATCNKPLDQQVQQDKFREDVFYRLGNLAVTMPPLRERLEDLPYLVQRFLESSGSQSYRVDNATLVAMARHPWPGNLRELQNRLSQAALLARNLRLEPSDLGLLTPTSAQRPDRFSLEAYRAKADQEAISTSLSLTHQNISAAARLLQISRVSLYRLMERHQLQPLSTHRSHLNPDRGNGESS